VFGIPQRGEEKKKKRSISYVRREKEGKIAQLIPISRREIKAGGKKTPRRGGKGKGLSFRVTPSRLLSIPERGRGGFSF